MKLRVISLSKNVLFYLLLGATLLAVQAHAFTLPDPVNKNFTINGNGTVTCNDTNLMWEIKGVPGTINDAIKIYTWTQAQIYIAQLNAANYAGYNDWRLPKITELGYIADYSILAPGPTIDTQFFQNTQPGQYWSSTPYAPNNEITWYFCFTDASRKYSGTNELFYVRAIREAN